MKKRFSKDNVLIHIEAKMQKLQEKWNFDPNNGWAQVEGAGFSKVMAYGEYQVLEELHEDLFYSNLES